jgi:peroxiredoxin
MPGPSAIVAPPPPSEGGVATRRTRLKYLTNARPSGPTSGIVFGVRTVGLWGLVLAGLVTSPANAGKVGRGTPDGADLIGRLAPPWEIGAGDWLQSPPLTLAQLRGKVVLVRWFMSTSCPLCSASAPTLNALHADYADRGLVVIGMYHHKDDEPLSVPRVAGWVHDYGFKFPVAVDRDWKTLHRWWLDGGHRDFTSVTFLIDQAGVIRRIHRGGALVLGSKDDAQMRSAIDALLPKT